MQEERKQRWLMRLDRYPLLAMLFLDVRFRVFLVLAILFCVCLGLFVSKIWTVSPEHFNPVIKISGLDWLQTRALKNSAQKEQAKGDYKAATFAWRAAIANNPSDVAAVRGSLENFQRLGRLTHAHMNQMMSFGYWLLRLTRTNEASLLLTTQVFEQYDLHDLALQLLMQAHRPLTPPEKAQQLKVLFQLGRMSDFQRQWDPALVRELPELDLYYAAYQAGWGSAGTISEGREKLERAAATPTTSRLAAELKMAVAYQTQDLPAYRRALESVPSGNPEKLSYYLNLWRLQSSLGEKDDARRSAQARKWEPASPGETLGLATAYLQLDLTNSALHVLRENAPKYSYLPDLWVAYGKILMDQRDWNAAEKAASEMRRQGIRALRGYSYFLEGWAALGLGRKKQAERVLDSLVATQFDHPALVLAVARPLIEMDEANRALNVLRRHEADLRQDSEYWQMLFLVGQKLGDSQLLLEAAEKAYALDPANSKSASNYAAALLLQRSRPEKAIEITLQLLGAHPRSNLVKINHSFALMLNQRAAEAAQLLSTIKESELTESERGAYAFGQFEANVRLGRFDNARRYLTKINRDKLFDAQRVQLDRLVRQLPQAAAGEK
jgi:hypothetical protein